MHLGTHRPSFTVNQIIALAICIATSLTVHSSYGQEDCFDGVDNNGNGLIDLNDPEGCGCVPLGDELIVNGDFEEFSACPNGFSQVPAAEGGYYYTNGGTTDFYHSCDYVGGGLYPSVEPLLGGENGNGMIGFFSDGPEWFNYREMVTQCLSAPLLPGVEYVMSFDIATTGSFNNGIALSDCSVLPIGLFGAVDCPIDIGANNYNGCLSDVGPYISLLEEDLSVLPNEFTTYTFTFTVPEEVSSLSIGGGCAPPTCTSQDNNYFYFDNWSVQALNGQVENAPSLSLNGSSCTGFNFIAETENALTYQWYVNGIAIQGENQPVFSLPPDSIPEVTLGVILDDGNGGTVCAFSESVQLTVAPEITVDATYESQVCPGETTPISLTVLPVDNYLYEWSTGEETQTIQAGIGTYDVTITNQETGCTASLSVSIEQCEGAPLAILLPDQTICQGESTSILAEVQGGSPPYEFNWTPALGNNAGPFVVSPDASAEYILEVTDAEGEQVTAVANVFVEDAVDLTFSLGTNTTLCEGRSVRIQPVPLIDGVTYTWSTGQTSPELDVNTAGTYTLTASTACSTFEDAISIAVDKNCGCEIYIPNAFTPDLDGLNEVFQVSTVCEFDSFELQIYNRWGDLVHTMTNPNDTWLGNYQGGSHHNGVTVYNYILIATPSEQIGPATTIVERGSITVLR